MIQGKKGFIWNGKWHCYVLGIGGARTDSVGEAVPKALGTEPPDSPTAATFVAAVTPKINGV
jgi:hypothetical protein